MSRKYNAQVPGDDDEREPILPTGDTEGDPADGNEDGQADNDQPYADTSEDPKNTPDFGTGVVPAEAPGFGDAQPTQVKPVENDTSTGGGIAMGERTLQSKTFIKNDPRDPDPLGR